MLLALRGFEQSPYQPSPDVRIVSDHDPRKTEYDVWDLPCGDGYHTYCS